MSSCVLRTAELRYSSLGTNARMEVAARISQYTRATVQRRRTPAHTMVQYCIDVQLRIQHISCWYSMRVCFSCLYLVRALFFLLCFTAVWSFVHTHASQFPCQFGGFLFHVSCIAFPFRSIPLPGEMLEYCHCELLFFCSWFRIERASTRFYCGASFFETVTNAFFCHLNIIFNIFVLFHWHYATAYAQFICSRVKPLRINRTFCHPFFVARLVFFHNKLRTLLLGHFFSFFFERSLLWPTYSSFCFVRIYLFWWRACIYENQLNENAGRFHVFSFIPKNETFTHLLRPVVI